MRDDGRDCHDGRMLTAGAPDVIAVLLARRAVRDIKPCCSRQGEGGGASVVARVAGTA